MRMAKIKMCWSGFTISVLQQLRALQRGEKILFYSGKILLRNRIARDQNQFHRLRKLVLVLPETFAEQTAGAAAVRSVTDFFAGNHAEFGRRTIRQFCPVGDEAAQNEAFSLLPDAHEIAVLRQPQGTAQTKAFRRRGIHKIKPA